MAQMDVAEQTTLPEQGNLPNATPAAFGAPVATAQGQIGVGLTSTGDILATRALAIQGLKNEATANNADVAFQNDLGQLEQQYYGLQGKAASDAYPKFQQDVTALRQQYLGSMTNPMAAQMLDQSLSYSISRSLRSGGTYAGEQSRNWVIQSSDARADMLVAQIGSHYTDSGYYDTATAAIKQSAADIGQIKGWTQDQIDLYAQSKIAAADKLVLDNKTSYLNSLPVNERAAALLGGETAPQGVVGGQEYHTITATIESGGNAGVGTNASGHTGLFQASQDWWKQFGGGSDINNADDQHKALDRETESNEPKLKDALRRNPTNADLYLAHQQGLQGAEAILKNPNALAADVVPAANIQANIPNDPQTGQPVLDYRTATAAQFSALWAKPYTDAGMAPTIASAPMGANSPAAIAASLPADVRMKMTKDTLDAWNTQSNAAYTQAQHVQEAQKRLTQQQQDQLTGPAQQQLLAHDADPSKPPPDLVALSQNPALQDARGQASIRTLINFRAELDRQRANPVPPGQSAQITQQLFRRMGLPDGDPNKITSMDQINDQFAPADGSKGLLSKGDRDWLETQFTNGKDATGQRLLTNANELFKAIGPQIDPSLGTDFGHSPFAPQRFYAYKQAVMAQIEQFRKEGKDPSVLFDPTPGNKDYVGSPGFMAPYTRSMTDLMNEAGSHVESQTTATDTGEGDTTGATGPEAPMPVPRAPVDYKSMGDLQAAINRHEISLPDAQQYALDKGFAKQAGVQPLPGKLHLDPSIAPKVPEGAPRPFGMGEYIENPDGSTSNEITVTVENPKLNGGKPTILPSLWVVNGKAVKVNEDKAAEFALKSGLKFPSFANEDEAEKFAVAREAKWQNIDPKNAAQVQALWDQGPKVPIGP